MSLAGITCLIQVTTIEGGDFIIDALAIREHVHKLNLAFTNPKKIKVSFCFYFIALISGFQYFS